MNNLLRISNVVLVVLGTMGLNYICTLSSDNAFSYSIWSVPAFFAIYFMLRRTMQDLTEVGLTKRNKKEYSAEKNFAEKKFAEKNTAQKSTAQENITEFAEKRELKRRLIYSAACAFFLALSMVLGGQLKKYGMTESGFAGKGIVIIWSLLLGIDIFPLFYYFFKFLSVKDGEHDSNVNKSNVHDSGTDIRYKSIHVFGVSYPAIFLCLIPVFLAYYPAVMAYDFNIQSLQASWGPPYFSAHHPIAHTLLIWVFFQIGKAFGSLQTGMAFYSVFQMLLMAASESYAVTMIYRLCHKRWAVIASILFFGVFPYNSILAVSVTKDVIFAGLALVFMLLMIERLFFYAEECPLWLNICTFIAGTAMLLFRNNAIYAFAAFGVIYVILSKGKEKIRAGALCLAIAVSGKLILLGLVTYCGYFGSGSSAEMYSVPMQQFARVGYYHGFLNGNELDEETYSLIDKYVSHEAWENYNPPIADTIKIYVSAYQYDKAWKTDMPSMWRAWTKVGMRYPNEYIDAFLCLTAGYWSFEDVTWAENLGVGLDERKGALFTFNASESEAQPDGIPSESKLPALERGLEEIVSNNCFYNWPVVSNLFKPAFYVWGLLLCIAAAFYNRKNKVLILAAFPLMYMGTLFLGPVVIVRYIMPVMLFLPMLAVLSVTVQPCHS